MVENSMFIEHYSELSPLIGVPTVGHSVDPAACGCLCWRYRQFCTLHWCGLAPSLSAGQGIACLEKVIYGGVYKRRAQLDK